MWKIEQRETTKYPLIQRVAPGVARSQFTYSTQYTKKSQASEPGEWGGRAEII